MKFLLITTTLILLASSLPAAAQVQSLQAWWIDTGDTDSTGLGNIAPLGDINGDGFSDFLVGSLNEEAFIYFGNTIIDTVPQHIITRPDSSSYDFGTFLFSIGDINGDGGIDFAIQARLAELPLENCIVYVYFGGPILDVYPDLVLDGPQNYESWFGINGTGIGDFNGDGGNDFIVLDEAYIIDYPNGITGRIYLYFGGEVLDSIPDWQIQGGNPFQKVGRDAAALGDINEDGFDDFVIVHPACSGPQGEVYMGYAAVYCGSSIPDTIPDIVIWGEGRDAALGLSVAGVDFNRDGLKDIVVGSHRDLPPDHLTSVYVYLVSSDMDSFPDYIFPDQGDLNNTTGEGLFGIDLNGDNWMDIVSNNPNNVLEAGKTFVYLGGFNPDTLLDAYYFQGIIDGALGVGASNVGDINGDGLEDMVIDEPGYNTYYTGNHWGRIHMILGDTSIHQSVGVEPLPSPGHPVDFSISISAFPNPFNEAVKLKYVLNTPYHQTGTLQIYNIRGEVVKEEIIRSEEGELIWNAGGFTSGIYFVRVRTERAQCTEKIVLLR